MRDLDPAKLLFLRAVAQTGSISAGARQLGWTQSAVSHHLRQLEDAVGTPLLVRHARGVRPTDAGQTLLAHADAIAEHLRLARVELDQAARLAHRTVTVAVYATAMATVLPRAMAILDAGIDVVSTVADPEDAVDQVRDGRVDIAVVFRSATEEVTDLTGVETVNLGREAYRFIAHVGLPLVARPDLALADLADQAWVVGCAYCRERLIMAAHESGFVPRIIRITNDHLVAQSFVAQNLAVSLMPATALTDFHNANLVARELAEFPSRAIIAACLPNALAAPAVRAMLAALTQAAHEATGESPGVPPTR